MQTNSRNQDGRVNVVNTNALISDSRFELLVHAIKDYAIYLLDLQGHIVSWNPGAERFKGYTAKEIIGRHFSCLYTEEDRIAGVPARALAIAAEQGRYEVEGLRVRKDGSRFWSSIVIDPVLDESGTLIGYAKVTRDLTAKKAAEQALFESEQRFRLLVQGVRDYAIYMLDPNGYVTDWNSGAVLIKGYSSDEIIGRHFSCFYTQEDRERGEPERGLALALQHNTFQNEGWRVRKNGSRFWASIVIDPIYSETGKLIGFAKVTRDVTERKLAQEEGDRQRDILSHAQKLEAIGRITGGVAHDFNNLLTIIRSAAELLGTASLSAEKRSRYLEIIVETAGRAALLTQQLLAFAREQPLNPEVLDIASRIQQLMHVVEMTVGANINVNIELPADLWAVYADASQFETAVLNLVINARDAMPTGGTLDIGARNATFLPSLRRHGNHVGTPGHFIAITIGDTGCGIEPSLLEQIFEPFFTTKELNKGTGLGLSQVYGFAKQSGGEVVVESQVGSGTTFTLYLPCAKAEHPAPSPDVALDARKNAKPSKVLLVEDNELVAEFAQSVLHEVGHNVTWVANAEAALDVLDARCSSFDLVLSDVVMPGISGIELGQEIRRRWPDLRVVLSSGYSPGLAQEGAHGFEFLQKPYTLEHLLAVIDCQQK
jgi:PAS domain S-box-containing protein